MLQSTPIIVVMYEVLFYARMPTKKVYNQLQQVLDSTNKDVHEAIVNAPFLLKLLTATLDLGILVLLRVNNKEGTVDRVALSDTELAKGAVKVSAKPFREIKIPLDAHTNSIVAALETGNIQIVDDWLHLFTPALTAEQARLNQAGASIECSVVIPFGSRKGAMIFSFYQPIEKIGKEHLTFARSYAKMAEKKLLA